MYGYLTEVLRLRLLFVLFTLVFAIQGQAPPSLLESQFPAPGVPRNTAIAFHFRAGFDVNRAQFTLRQTDTNTEVRFSQEYIWVDSLAVQLVLRPAATLAATTSYTVTVAPSRHC